MFDFTGDVSIKYLLLKYHYRGSESYKLEITTDIITTESHPCVKTFISKNRFNKTIVVIHMSAHVVFTTPLDY